MKVKEDSTYQTLLIQYFRSTWEKLPLRGTHRRVRDGVQEEHRQLEVLGCVLVLCLMLASWSHGAWLVARCSFVMELEVPEEEDIQS